MTIKCLIEIGSNAIKLFIAEIFNNGTVEPIEITRRMTLLAKGLKETGKLSIESKNQTLMYLEEYIEKCKKYKIDTSNILINATAACRNASDGQEFINTIKKQFNLQNVRILSGEDESKYTFLGTLKSIETDNESMFYVIDIGGGSFQLSIGTKDNFMYGKSIPIGCNNIAEQFSLKQITTENNINSAVNYVENYYIEGIDLPKYTLKAFGAGGTIKIIQLMLRSRSDYTSIKYNELINMAHYLAKLNIEERLDWFKQKYNDTKFCLDAGLTIERAEIFLAGVCILIGLFKKLSLKEIFLSKTDAKDYLMSLPNLNTILF